MEKHHATLLYGDTLEVSKVPDEYKVQTSDVLHIVRDRFSIDDARDLVALSWQTPFENEHRVFVILTRDIASEAQNALLKLLEEPPVYALFYLLMPKTAVLLPTLLSRLRVETEDRPASTLANESFATFHAASYAERLELIAQKTKEKDFRWIEDVLLGCEYFATLPNKNDAQLLSSILMCRQYIAYKGASAKMLLEDLALALPLM